MSERNRVAQWFVENEDEWEFVTGVLGFIIFIGPAFITMINTFDYFWSHLTTLDMKVAMGLPTVALSLAIGALILIGPIILASEGPYAIIDWMGADTNE